MFSVNGNIVCTVNYYAVFLDNYGRIYASNFSCSKVSNSGLISTNFFGSYTLNNSGSVYATNFNCGDTVNSGTIEICNDGYIDLGAFKLVDNGVLNLNHLLIKANEPLDPKLKSYLERTGDNSVSIDDSAIVLTGKFNVNLEEARKELPHLFSDFVKATRGYETIPGHWFANSYPRVSSVSKNTGKQEFWRFKTINQRFNLNSAITDVFVGLLTVALFGSDIGREARFDVFDKRVVYKDIDKKHHESLSNDDNKNQILQHYIISEMSKSKVDFINSMNNICFGDKNLQAQSGALSWMYNSAKSMFYEQPEQMPIDWIRNEMTKEQTLLQMNKLLDSMVNARAACLDVKNQILADLNAVNSKYSRQQIEEEILPQIDVLILNFTNNILVMREYVQLNSLTLERARLVLN